MQQTVDATTTVDVDLVMEVPLFGLSSFYAAVAATTAPASSTIAVAAVTTATIVVYGLSFFSSSAAADVAAMVDVSNSEAYKMATVFRRLFTLLSYFFIFKGILFYQIASRTIFSLLLVVFLF